VSTYYAKPSKWMKMMKASIADCAPIFNSQRMVNEYFHKFYK